VSLLQDMKMPLLLAALLGAAVAAAWRGPAADAAERPNSAPRILTPKPGPAPRINGPTVIGVRPGRPFIYRIPTTGDRPLAFAVEHLPASLTVDPQSGVIRGAAPAAAGQVVVRLKATNASGSATRELRIVVGDQLALTPPMGWNSWYIHYDRVSDQHMRAAADAMIRTGMADFGYSYVNIDDCWMKKRGDQPYRDDDGAVLPNKKFPDMKALADYIHGKGLRAGLYISPGPWTCAGYVGSYKHERTDAEKFAEWGFDFLKYDWCSYSQVADRRKLADLQRPYRQMGQILKQLDRDITSS